ncbi:MAG: hypothetical protein AAF806_20905 [Bacteroidota bacterium]
MVEQEKKSIATGLGRTVASIYNPDLLTKQQLIDSFVVRLKKFKKLYKDIQSAKMEVPEQHVLIIGLRGMGKTTLLLRLSYEVENDDQLNGWLIPLVFNEEEYAISRLFKFWETIAQYLERRDERFRGLFDEMDELYEQSKDRYEERAFKLLLSKLREKGQKLLLFIDNFGDMFKRFSKEEKQRLREVLTTCPDIRIIAGSAVAAESFFKYDDPFFELFKIERLEGLNKKETEQLLLELGAHYPTNPIEEILEKEPERVETLRRLTGGIPRTIVLLFEIFVDDKNGDAFTDLEAVLDRVTPLYKHRMDDLPAQQQEIMDAIALAWDAVSAKEIAQRARLTSRVVSAALKQMATNNLIDIQRTNTKNHLYRLHDRFFNIWYLMRMARKGDKNKVLWLIRFLEQWCSEEQLSKRTKALFKAMNKGGFHTKGAFYLSTALFHSKKNTIESRYEISKNTSRYLKDKDLSLHQELQRSDISHFGEGMKLMKQRDFEGAWEKLNTIKNKEAQDYLLLSALCWHRGDCEESDAFYKKAKEMGALHPDRVMGNIFRDYLNDYKHAEEYYLKAIEIGDGKACRKLGWIYEDELKDYEKAEKYYQKAIDKGETYAWLYMGDLYCDNLKDYKRAKEFYLKAIDNEHFDAIKHLGLLHINELKEYKKGEEYYWQAIEKEVTNSWGYLATLYRDEYEDYEKAEEFYLKGAEAGHLDNLRLLGWMYANKLEEYEKAEKYYCQAIEKGVTSSWGYLATLYRDEYEDYEKAEEFYLKGAEAGHLDNLRLLGWMYANKLKEYEKAEKYYYQAIEKGVTSSWGYLATLYRDEYEDYKKAEEFYLKGAEAGHFDDLRLLGWMYANKLKDHEKAKKYYRQAAEEGETEAWGYLAELYQNEDYEKTEKFYKKAIEKGHTNNINLLGWLYEDKIKDYKTAEKYYYWAINKKETIGWGFLGNLYCDKHKKYDKAEEFYLKLMPFDETEAIKGLIEVYSYDEKFEKAKKYGKKLMDINDKEATIFYAAILFLEKKSPNEALKYAFLGLKNSNNPILSKYVTFCILLWNENYKPAFDLFQEFQFEEEFFSDEDSESELFCLLLAKNQYPYLYNYFTSEKAEALQLKDRLKPIWYALLYYMQDKHKADYLRMPPELKETVEEIVEKVEQMRVDYAIEK